MAAGYGRNRSAGVACLTDVVEPVGGLLGATAAWLAAALLPAILAFAGGAVLYIISDEIALHCASLPVLDARDGEEIPGYDEHGLPS